jgi:hypothetical protein
VRRRLVYHSLGPEPHAIRLQHGADMDYLGVGDGRREESWHGDVAVGPAWTGVEWSRYRPSSNTRYP